MKTGLASNENLNIFIFELNYEKFVKLRTENNIHIIKNKTKFVSTSNLDVNGNFIYLLLLNFGCNYFIKISRK